MYKTNRKNLMKKLPKIGDNSDLILFMAEHTGQELIFVIIIKSKIPVYK